MTLLLRFRSADLLQCRFAISPLNETADALRALSNPKAAAYHLPWQRQARPLVPALGIEPLLAILSVRGYQPDFLSPAPDGPFTEIGAELDRVRATPPAKVAAELAECLDTAPDDLARDRPGVHDPHRPVPRPPADRAGDGAGRHHGSLGRDLL
jgi:hypothetical protein